MSLPSPRTLFGLAARAEMVTWALLLLAMALRYSGVTDALMPFAGGVHGFVFLSYVVATVAVWVDGRWPAARGLLGLGSAVIPFLTVPFERSADRRGDLPARWQVLERAPGERGALDSALRWVLRHPVASLLIALVLVSGVFTALLTAGPPTEWGR